MMSSAVANRFKQENINNILSYPKPSTEQEVEQFLKLCQTYSLDVQYKSNDAESLYKEINYSTACYSIIGSLEWEVQQQAAFEKLKELINSVYEEYVASTKSITPLELKDQDVLNNQSGNN